jgi:hypothetical protein
MDAPDLPSGPFPPPATGMRPRNELTFDAEKEYYREYRRIVFDFDYWANSRSTMRFIFGLLNLSRSTILASLLLPVMIITTWGFCVALLHYLGVGPAFANAFPWLATHFPVKFDDAPIALTGSILPLLLVFRTNNAAGRFDEVRLCVTYWSNMAAVYTRGTLYFISHAATLRVHFIISANAKVACRVLKYAVQLEDACTCLTGNRANSHQLLQARKMWGLLLNRTRNLVREAITFFPADDVHSKATFARWTIALSLALKCHLRPYDDLRSDMEGLLTECEMRLFMSADHKVRSRSAFLGTSNLVLFCGGYKNWPCCKVLHHIHPPDTRRCPCSWLLSFPIVIQ